MSDQQLELASYLKRAGIAAANASVSPDWKDRADAVIHRLAMSGQDFTSEAVTAEVGQPTGENGENKPNAVGARFCAAARQGVIERVGFRKATRPNQHATMIGLWRGKL